MDSNSKQLFQDFDQHFQLVMHKIEELVVNRNEMNIMIEACMTQILQAINGTNSGDTTLMIGNTPQCPHKTARPTPSLAPTMTLMNIDQTTQANGSLHPNPPASHTNHKYDGSHALASTHQ